MQEKLTFHLDGSLARDHELNFYEAARFQYAAARLIVKLEQFRINGKFPKKITNKSNKDILLQTHKNGSFEISILLPIVAMAAQDAFLSVSMGQLMSYAFERIVGKTSDSDVAIALNANKAIVDKIGAIHENDTKLIKQALDIIQEDRGIMEDLRLELRETLERRIAETTREHEMTERHDQWVRIDSPREQKLISMSAPLVSEMATILRRSADTMEIVTTDSAENPKAILFLNRQMAEEIETSVVDKEITPILGDIIQYNKETGWGKARLSISSKPLSFNVPSDIKGRIQGMLLASMGNDKAYIQTYVVRDKAKEPVRLIIVGVLPPPPE